MTEPMTAEHARRAAAREQLKARRAALTPGKRRKANALTAAFVAVVVAVPVAFVWWTAANYGAALCHTRGTIASCSSYDAAVGKAVARAGDPVFVVGGGSAPSGACLSPVPRRAGWWSYSLTYAPDCTDRGGRYVALPVVAK